MRRLLAFLFLLPLAAFAQNPQRSSYAIQNNANYAKVVPHAVITLCTFNAQLQCNSTVTIFSDPQLTAPIAYPFYADGNGYFDYYALAGTYVERQCAPASTCSYFQISLIGGPAGTGTVTSFSAGNLAPLFTTSVTNSTTTPALSFNLTSAANDTFLANFSGSTGAPSYWTLAAGSNITLTPSGSTLTVSATGGTSGVTEIIPGTNITCSPNVGGNCVGNVTVNSTASGPVVQVNSTPISPASPANFADTASVTWAFTGGQIKATATAASALTLQTNSVNNSSQSTLNLEQGSNVTVTNTSAGNVLISASATTALEPLINAPISGQFVTIYPTVGTITSDPTGGGVINATSGRMTWACTNGSGLCTVAPVALANWTGFTLPGYVNPANVTAVYLDAVTSLQSFNTQIPTGGANQTKLSCTGNGSTLFSGGFPPNYPYASTEVTLTSSLTGSTVGTVTCNMQLGSSTALQSGEIATVSAIRLLVYYTGTAPPVDNNTYIVPPLQYIPALQELQIDPNAEFHGLDLIATTVGLLPAIPINADLMELVNNGASKTDCTAGGGSSLVLCYWNGSAWSAYANGTSAQISGTFVGVPANNQIILYAPMTVALTVPSSCTGSLAHAAVAATSTSVFTIRDLTASTTLCSASFAASGVAATLSGSGGVISQGDVIEFVGPSTADVTLSTIGISLAANR